MDEEVCNPLRVWHNLGVPASMSQSQLELVRQSAYPLVSTSQINGINNTAKLILSVRQNGVVYFELQKICLCSDRRYDFSRVNN